jgi:hypothetical protein
MTAMRFIAAAAALAASLGCTKQSSRGPVQWTASNPSSPVGQTAAQAWSRSTSSDKRVTPAATGIPSTQGPASAPALIDTSCVEQAPGVTNVQPEPRPRWPYNGVTLQLGYGPP